jgi:predicted nucleic acid-binding protein
MTAFVDTSAFFAIMDADDKMHAPAKKEWERLLADGASFRTTNYVLVETSALLQSRIGLEGLRAFAADVMPVLDVVWVDEVMHLSAQHALLVASRRDLSLVDCASFETMRRLQIDAAFCFDSHFSQQGFQVLPSV